MPAGLEYQFKNTCSENYLEAIIVSEEVPEDFRTPGARGSVPAGAFLVIVGVLFLLDLNTDISLDWIENWWPLLLVGGGAWLIFKARRQGE